MYGYKGKQHIKLPVLHAPLSTAAASARTTVSGWNNCQPKATRYSSRAARKTCFSLAAHGFHAICFNSETVTIPPTLVYRLTFRFKHIVLLFDMDKTAGKVHASRKTIGRIWRETPAAPALPGTKEEKDISDYFKAGNTREDFLKLFIEFLDNLYSDTLIMLKSCEIDFNNPPAKAQEIISAGDVPLGTQGNLSASPGARERERAIARAWPHADTDHRKAVSESDSYDD